MGTTAGISRALRNYPHKCASPIVTRKPGSLAALLYLVIEILATGVPVVIALNMSDEAARDGIAIDTARLEAPTGAEVVMVQEIGVAVIVLGALAFLARRLFGRPPDQPKAVTFVPIDKLRKKPDERCH